MVENCSAAWLVSDISLCIMIIFSAAALDGRNYCFIWRTCKHYGFFSKTGGQAEVLFHEHNSNTTSVCCPSSSFSASQQQLHRPKSHRPHGHTPAPRPKPPLSSSTPSGWLFKTRQEARESSVLVLKGMKDAAVGGFKYHNNQMLK